MPSASNEVEHLTETYCVKGLTNFSTRREYILSFLGRRTLAANYKTCNMLIYCVN